MSEVKKPTVPTIADKPIIGLKSNKNYITSNPIDNILIPTCKKAPVLNHDESIFLNAYISFLLLFGKLFHE